MSVVAYNNRSMMAALGVGAAKVTAAAASLVMLSVVGRSLTDEGFGKFVGSVTLGTFVGVLIGLGANDLAVKLIPRFRVDGNVLAVGQLRRWVVSRITRIAVLAAVGLSGLGLVLPGMSPQLPVASALVVPMAVSVTVVGLYRAEGLTAEGLIWRDIGWRLGLTALVVLLPSITSTRLDGYAIATIAAVLLTGLVIVQLLLLQLVRRPASLVRYTVDQAVEWRGQSRRVTLAMLVIVAREHLGASIAALVLSPKDAGFYIGATRIAAISALPTLAVMLAVGPSLSKGVYISNRENITKQLAVVVGWTSVLGTGAFTVLLLWSDLLIGLLGYEAFSDGRIVWILAAGNLAASINGASVQMMIWTDNERRLAQIGIAATSVVFCGQLLTGFLMGPVAMAVVQAVGVLAWSTVLTVWLRRNLGFDPSVMGLAAYVLSGRTKS